MGFEKKKKPQCNSTFQTRRAKQTKHDLLLSKAVSGFVHVFFGCVWTCVVFIGVWIECVSLWVAIKRMGLICLPFVLPWLFFSIKNECLPFCSLSLFPSSLFLSFSLLSPLYPLYFLQAISIYHSIHAHTHTHACMRTPWHFLPSFAPPGSLLPSHSLQTPLSFWTYFIKGPARR